MTAHPCSRIATFVLCGMMLTASAVRAQTPVYPVKLSGSGQYLVDQNNVPYFINGESAWSLINKLQDADADFFLENRRQKGYNAFLTMLIEAGSNNAANAYGVQPFTTPENFDTPNEAFFAHADQIIDMAAAKGQMLMIAPLYLGWGCQPPGWCNAVKNSSSATVRQWGRYVGNRYKNKPNIIWIMSGDVDAVSQGVGPKLEEFVAGLREFDTNHLITVHNSRGQAGSSVWPNATWLTLNSLYTDNITYNQAASEYNRVPRKPGFLIESYYENEHSSTPLSLRSQAYWVVLAGGLAGQMFGNCPVTTFSTGQGFCGTPNWKNYLDTAGAQTVGMVGSLFKSRAFYDLVPDLNHTVMTAGYQSGTTYANAARTSSGSTVIAYIPTQRAVTFDMTKVAGTTARTWWFNPRTGMSTAGGDFPTTGTRNFTPPDGDDWVLVLDNAALNLSGPGAGTTPPAPAAPTNVRIVGQ